jgi:hypothetical protein
MEPEDHILNGEILPPEYVRDMAIFHTHEAFDDLCRRYGKTQATKLWLEVPKEHDDEH